MMTGITAFVSLSSCEKIKNEIVSNIDPFLYSSVTSFEIPALAAPFEYTAPEQTETIHINDIIKDNAGLNLNINNFSSIALKDIRLHLKNGTNADNWADFEYLNVEANTDKGISAGKPWLKSSISIPNNATERFSDKMLVFVNANIKDYIDGEATTVHFRLSAKTRSVITNPMQIDATIDYEFKP